jgi:hypothetical protein
LFEHDLFGKPLHTFPDHALKAFARELQPRRIYANRPKLAAGTAWTSSTDTVLDCTYRQG